MIRLFRQNRRLGRQFFAIGSFLADRQHAEHGIADSQIGYICADFADDTGKIATADIGKKGGRGIGTRANLPVGAVDAGRADIGNDFAGPGDGIRQVAVFQYVGTAIFFEIYCFHRCSGLLSDCCLIV